MDIYDYIKLCYFFKILLGSVSCPVFISVLYNFYIFFCDTPRKGLHLGDIVSIYVLTNHSY